MVDENGSWIGYLPEWIVFDSEQQSITIKETNSYLAGSFNVMLIAEINDIDETQT